MASFGQTTKATTPSGIATALNYRLAVPVYFGRPITATSMSQMTPLFIPGCSQFMVEFSGDFLRQDAAGAVTAAGQDGKIDFLIDPATGQERTRWYGLPRDLNGDGVILGGVVGMDPNTLVDVVPIRDVLKTANLAALSNEATLPTLVTDYGLATGGLAAGASYDVVWFTNQSYPTNVRFIMKVEDTAGRVAAGRTYEFTMAMP